MIEDVSNPDGVTVNISLISHTNAGKTTLARTLLGRDVGEVRDAAHVTDVATGYVMLQAGADTLVLWDTPGFGDTARLLKRLKLSGNPLGWLLTQVWDRFRDRPFWSNQQAARNAREQSDVILYLVNASEDPAAASYVAQELELLSWIGKPVLLLLNQMGPPGPDGALEEGRWLGHLQNFAVVKGALTLDAFARCWVQEGNLLRSVAGLLQPDKRAAMSRLTSAWAEQNLQRFRSSMRILADELASTAADQQELGSSSWQGRLGALVRGVQGREDPAARRAMRKLTERLEARARLSSEALIREHGLTGRAAVEALRQLERGYATVAPAKAGLAAVLGGVASGAIGGVAADVVSGGLTLGGGMIVGGVLGALAAGAAAWGYNVVRGEKGPVVRWSDEFFFMLFRSALLRYLAVAHFGRGRGEFEEGEHPAYWKSAVEEASEKVRRNILASWKQGRDGNSAALVTDLQARLTECSVVLLVQLYPDARELLEGELSNLEQISHQTLGLS